MEDKARGLVVVIVGIAVALFIASALLPDAILAMADANQTGWDASTISMWDILSTIAILAIFIAIIALGISLL